MAETVLVTGATGFIAKHVIRALLERGYAVRGSVRSQARAAEVTSTIAGHGGDLGRLSFVVADLGSDEGWAEAVRGCRYVQHIASPFPMVQPRDREALVPAARQGTLRVVGAALDAHVERVVLTSSMVAMMYRPDRLAVTHPVESDWSDAEWSAASAYIVSKIRAERAAWDLAIGRGAQDRLVAVNPGFVLGPLLDRASGTSVDVIRLILEGRYPPCRRRPTRSSTSGTWPSSMRQRWWRTWRDAD